jgi:hypothetical protein
MPYFAGCGIGSTNVRRSPGDFSGCDASLWISEFSNCLNDESTTPKQFHPDQLVLCGDRKSIGGCLRKQEFGQNTRLEKVKGRRARASCLSRQGPPNGRFRQRFLNTVSERNSQNAPQSKRQVRRPRTDASLHDSIPDSGFLRPTNLNDGSREKNVALFRCAQSSMGKSSR